MSTESNRDARRIQRKAVQRDQPLPKGQGTHRGEAGSQKDGQAGLGRVEGEKDAKHPKVKPDQE